MLVEVKVEIRGRWNAWTLPLLGRWPVAKKLRVLCVRSVCDRAKVASAAAPVVTALPNPSPQRLQPRRRFPQVLRKPFSAESFRDEKNYCSYFCQFNFEKSAMRHAAVIFAENQESVGNYFSAIFKPVRDEIRFCRQHWKFKIQNQLNRDKLRRIQPTP